MKYTRYTRVFLALLWALWMLFMFSESLSPRMELIATFERDLLHAEARKPALAGRRRCVWNGGLAQCNDGLFLPLKIRGD